MAASSTTVPSRAKALAQLQEKYTHAAIDAAMGKFLLNSVGWKTGASDRPSVIGGLGDTTSREPISTNAYNNARTVIEQAQQARKNGQSRKGLSLLRQFRAGARGLFVESVYAEGASFLRRMRSGLRNIYRLFTFR